MTTFRDNATPRWFSPWSAIHFRNLSRFSVTREHVKVTSDSHIGHLDFKRSTLTQTRPFTQQPQQVYKACLKATEQAALVGEVYVQPWMSQERLPPYSCLQALPSLPLFDCKSYSKPTDDPNICPAVLGCWLLHQVQILSPEAEPPFPFT